jgi:hypothetical protein
LERSVEDSCFEDDSDAIQHDVATLRGGERATTPLAVDAEKLSELAKRAASSAACLAASAGTTHPPRGQRG